MQSHKIFPPGVLIRIARWPMPNLGSVQIEMKRWSVCKGLVWFMYFGEVEDFIAPRVVKLWPVGGTNCLAVLKGKSAASYLAVKLIFG
jgi:hypothetical protein